MKLIENISVSLRTVGKSLVNNAVSMQDCCLFVSLTQHSAKLRIITDLLYGIIQSFMYISEYSMYVSYKS